MPFFLGQIGNLQQLPNPQRGLDFTLVRKGGTHDLLSGGQVVDLIAYKRVYQLQWLWMTQDQLGILESLYSIQGPFALIDPARRNHLDINQAGGTGTFLNTTGFNVDTGTQASDATITNPSILPPNSLRWSNSAALASASHGPKTGAAYSTADYINDIAVLAGAVYSPSVYAVRSATNAITCQIILEWYTALGAFISRGTGSGVALSTSPSWQRLTLANQTAPATAAFAKVGVWNTATTLGATDVYTDGWQLEPGPAVNNWVQGTGVPMVDFDTGGQGGTAGLASQIIHKQGSSGQPRFNVQAVLVETV